MTKKLGIVLVTLISTIHGAVQAADKVRIAFPTFNVVFFTAGLAHEAGFLRDEGLETEIIRMTAPVCIVALANGDIDYTMVTGSVIQGALRGLPIKLVAGFIDRPTVTLIAHGKYKSVKDLKGRTLGISAFEAQPHVMARMIMKHFGIDLDKEVKLLALGSEHARFTALRQGIVDAIMLSPPADVEGRRLGFSILARASELFNYPTAGLATRDKKIKERPNEVKRILRAMIKANRFIRENREGAIQVLAKWGRTDIEYATGSYESTWSVYSPDGSISDDGLRRIIEDTKKVLKISREVSFGEVADFTLLREVQTELGIGK